MLDSIRSLLRPAAPTPPAAPGSITVSDLDKVDLDRLAPETIIDLAYVLLLRRVPDPVGRAHWSGEIAAGRLSADDLVEALLDSPEYRMRRRAPLHSVLHRARQIWCGSLPPFETVLDIGGSSLKDERGALIELGYPHRPREILVFDLPPDEQYWGRPSYRQDRPYRRFNWRTFNWGTVRYIHGRAERIAEAGELAGRRFGAVYMGQTIEHIEKDALPEVLAWIADHLEEGGRLIFDTPNRAITRLQSPDAFIDPDHKHEYTPEEMAGVVERAGFAVDKRTGLCDMPGSLAQGIFNPLEVYDSELVNDRPETSYLFAFECVRAR